jgi:integrase
VFLDSAEAIQALLDAATDLDARRVARTAGRRALIATLVFAGLRTGAACAPRWRDVDLAAGRLVVAEAKTEAGVREVELLAVLRDELDTYKLRSRAAAPEDLVFTTATGAPRDWTNARERVILAVVECVGELHVARPSGRGRHGATHLARRSARGSGGRPRLSGHGRPRAFVVSRRGARVRP